MEHYNAFFTSHGWHLGLPLGVPRAFRLRSRGYTTRRCVRTLFVFFPSLSVVTNGCSHWQHWHHGHPGDCSSPSTRPNCPLREPDPFRSATGPRHRQRAAAGAEASIENEAVTDESTVETGAALFAHVRVGSGDVHTGQHKTAIPGWAPRYMPVPRSSANAWFDDKLAAAHSDTRVERPGGNFLKTHAGKRRHPPAVVAGCLDRRPGWQCFGHSAQPRRTQTKNAVAECDDERNPRAIAARAQRTRPPIAPSRNGPFSG